MKVVAVTVTYNSSDLLKRCVDALLTQTHKVDKIIIVDNDSAPEHKEKIKALASGEETIDVVFMKENLGGAGGFEKGMRYAAENCDAVWYCLMDDDAFPTEECLEKLLEHCNLPDVGCLTPLIYGVDNEEFQLYHHKRIVKFSSTDKTIYKNLKSVPEVSKIQANAFVGPLISKTAVKKVGFPDGGLFIYGDDTEYTYRIFCSGFNVYLIKNAVIKHRDVLLNNSNNYKAWWKAYYMFRNRVMFVDEFNKTAFGKFIGKMFVKYRLFKMSVKARIRRIPRKYKKIRIQMLKQAYADGKKGISGKTVDPVIFNRQFEDVK